MNPKNTLCLIVDIQERLLPALSGTDKMLERCRLLIQGLTALDVPSAVTEQISERFGQHRIRRIAAVTRRYACCRKKPILGVFARNSGNITQKRHQKRYFGWSGSAYLYASDGLGFESARLYCVPAF